MIIFSYYKGNQQYFMMSVNNSSQGIGFDIKDFIELLQKNQNSHNRRRESVESDKLSVILSASEPESSMGDKQNSHASANKSNLTSYSSDQAETLFREIKKTDLNGDTKQMLNKLEAIFFDMKKTLIQQGSKLKIIENQYEEEKKGTDQMLKALIKMDEAQKQLWANYNELLNNSKSYQNKIQDLEMENQNLRNDLSQKWEDIEFMRKLVLVANQNYQSLDRKCKQLQNDQRNSFRFQEQRSSPQISSRTVRAKKKSSVSPAVSERSNLSARKSQFEENYRRLVLRTLKSKASR